jgi:hypothetical protein
MLGTHGGGGGTMYGAFWQRAWPDGRGVDDCCLEAEH